MNKNNRAWWGLILLLSLGGCAVKQDTGIIRQISISSRGVTYAIAVNGVDSPILGSDSLIGSTMSGPLEALGLKTQPGANSIEVKILEVAPENTPYFHLDLQEFKAGEVVDTTQPTASVVLVTDDRTEAQLVKGTAWTYNFTLP